MNEDKINRFIKNGKLKPISLDKSKIKSLLNSIEINAKVIISIPLNEKSSTIIFRELYESIRQLGDAKWWSLGFEPQSHDVSLDVLKETNIKNKYKLNNLDRFKMIRHDANYRGFQVSQDQAEEMIAFWNLIGKVILRSLRRDLG